jgi:hypothetical protein
VKNICHLDHRHLRHLIQVLLRLPLMYFHRRRRQRKSRNFQLLMTQFLRHLSLPLDLPNFRLLPMRHRRRLCRFVVVLIQQCHRLHYLVMVMLMAYCQRHPISLLMCLDQHRHLSRLPCRWHRLLHLRRRLLL